MKELRIKFDFSHGPIWKDKFDPVTGSWSTGIPVIDNDRSLNFLNDKIQDEYNTLYSFDNDGQFVFDNEEFKKKRNDFVSSIQALILRANELNDGSFYIVDEETQNLLSAQS